MPPHLDLSREGRARSSISHPWWIFLRKQLNGVYGATKAFVIALSHYCSASWPTKASAVKLSCRARRRPTSGKSLASPGRSSPRPSLCRRKTWWMRSGRARSGRSGYDSRPPGWRGVESFRGGTPRPGAAIRVLNTGSPIRDWYSTTGARPRKMLI
jgi:hypothetical protein